MVDAGHTTVVLDVGGWLARAAAVAGPAAEALAGPLLETLEAAGVDPRLTVQVPLPQAALPGEGPLLADPHALVRAFAGALREAEAALGPHHLAVAGGTLDATITLAAGAGSTAAARLALTIAPRTPR